MAELCVLVLLFQLCIRFPGVFAGELHEMDRFDISIAERKVVDDLRAPQNSVAEQFFGCDLNIIAKRKEHYGEYLYENRYCGQ
jgi:hypothetical protein